ncbi:MAG: fatty acid desaturase [Proteobacteria bacterium]|nr:fatty acid desaturase [Pseudomonadota bacterium]
MNDVAEPNEQIQTTIQASRAVREIIGKENIVPLTQRRNGPGLLFAGAHATLLTASGYVLWSALGTWWVIPATFLHGTLISHLFAPYHEAIHGTPFSSRWLNRSLCWLTGLILMLPPTSFQYEHADHHTYTQNVDRDPQMIPIGERLGGYVYYASSIPYFKGIFTNLFSYAFGRMPTLTARSVPEAARRRVQVDALVFLSVYGALAVGSIVLETWAVAMFWLIPRMVGEPIERIVRMSEHVGCARTEDMLVNTRTVLTFRPVRWLSWNMALHTAHHAIPQVPFHALPQLHRLIEANISELRHGYIDTVRFHIENARLNAIDGSSTRQ